MAKETIKIAHEDIPGIGDLLGKHLCHIRRTVDGTGFAFCFGDTPEATKGKLVICKMTQVGGKVQINLYAKGNWEDQQRVLYESN